jgi:hypothetical protein
MQFSPNENGGAYYKKSDKFILGSRRFTDG